MDEAFIRRIRLARERGEAVPTDADALGRLAASMMYSLAVRARAGARRAELERIAEDALTLLCGPAAR